MAGFALFLIAAFLILFVVAMCKILAKADIPWGFFFIPFYGIYCTYKAADCTGIFWANLIFGVINAVVGVPVVSLIISIILLILSFVYCKSLAEAFGKGTGFAIGLFLLAPIFICILAFGDAEHQASAASSYVTSAAKNWKCPECSTVNAGYRSTCKNCSFVKPILYASNTVETVSSGSSVSSGKTNPIKDTWMCPNCETRNPNTTRNCKGCGALK